MKYLRTGLVVVLVVAFAGVFAWAYFGQTGAPAPSPGPSDESVAVSHGQFGHYSYVITKSPDGKERTASFTPLIKDDDAEVTPVLRDLVRVSYGNVMADDTEPKVVSLDEKNYVSFPLDHGGRVYFQVFTNQKGEVGSVKYWQDL